MLSMVKCLWYAKDRYLSQKAQGMVEYALIIAFVVAIAVALSSDGGLASAIKGVFTSASDQINGTGGTGGTSGTSGTSSTSSTSN